MNVNIDNSQNVRFKLNKHAARYKNVMIVKIVS